MADESLHQSRQLERAQVDAMATAEQTEESVNGPKAFGEASPLLHARASTDSVTFPPIETTRSLDDTSNAWLEDEDAQAKASQETKSSWYMFLLTLSIGGLQIAWSVETSNFSPYLLSLGTSKSLLALIWIAGPLSGVLVQPYVGVKSDQCRSRFGRRRPFMVGGAVATAVSLLALAWVREITAFVLHDIFGADLDSSGVKVSTIVLAIIFVYILDCAINVVQAGIRAFIVDNAPTHQQDNANAWASRATGVGNIVGYLFGKSDLPNILWFFGKTQFQILCVIASLALLSTLTISCLTIHERDPRKDKSPEESKGGLLDFFRRLYRAVRKLPPQIKAVCMVQFFAWIGWFPFLFYSSTYIGEIYAQPIFSTRPDLTPEEVDEIWQQATRIGTQALFVFAITTFAASVLLPFIVASVVNSSESMERPAADSFSNSNGSFGKNGGGSHLAALKNHMVQISSRMPSTKLRWLTLRRAWLISHIIFAAIMWSTFFVHSTTAGTILIALVGIPWAMTNWAPFALIATEIGKRDRTRQGYIRPQSDEQSESQEDHDDGTDQAGVVLGIHNVAISAPQIIATLVSSVIFKVLQKPRGSVGDDSVAWTLRFGGLAALVAAWFCSRIAEERIDR